MMAAIPRSPVASELDRRFLVITHKIVTLSLQAGKYCGILLRAEAPPGALRDSTIPLSGVV